ncbi:Uncharacterised protein [Mycobacteroides abscessus subsp. abscessus]|nr:Uncharacterised protein [Mycobacteroides abscessus subsp. abscessus]
MGRLKVGMPTAMLPSPGASSGAYQPPASSVTAVSVVMSNQIQPPSSNGASSVSNSTVVDSAPAGTENSLPCTWIREPSALER